MLNLVLIQEETNHIPKSSLFGAVDHCTCMKVVRAYFVRRRSEWTVSNNHPEEGNESSIIFSHQNIAIFSRDLTKTIEYGCIRASKASYRRYMRWLEYCLQEHRFRACMDNSSNQQPTQTNKQTNNMLKTQVLPRSIS